MIYYILLRPADLLSFLLSLYLALFNTHPLHIIIHPARVITVHTYKHHKHHKTHPCHDKKTNDDGDGDDDDLYPWLKGLCICLAKTRQGKARQGKAREGKERSTHTEARTHTKRTYSNTTHACIHSSSSPFPLPPLPAAFAGVKTS